MKKLPVNLQGFSLNLLKMLLLIRMRMKNIKFFWQIKKINGKLINHMRSCIFRKDNSNIVRIFSIMNVNVVLYECKKKLDQLSNL